MTAPRASHLIPTESVAIARVFLALQDVCGADPHHEAAVEYLRAKALVESVDFGEPEPRDRIVAHRRARAATRRAEALDAFRAEVGRLLDGLGS